MPVENRVIQQAYKFALDPTPRQERAFASHVGGARFAYNWGMARIIEALDAYTAEKEAGTKPTTRRPRHFDLCKAWIVWKDTAEWTDRDTGEVTVGVPWVSNNSASTYQAALRDAHGAWQRFFDSRSGKLRGRRVGRPRFKTKHRARKAFQVHDRALDLADSKHVKLPKIGVVKTHESTRKLLRRLRKPDVVCPECYAAGIVPAKEPGTTKKCPSCKGKQRVPTARIVRGTISQHSDGRWYIALTVELVRKIRTGPSRRQRAGGTIGIDLGVRSLIVTSQGEKVGHPAHLEAALGKLATAQRALARCEKGSQRRVRAAAKVAKLHARVGHLRLDATQKLTSHLVHSHERIGVEGWDIQQTMQYGSKDLPKRVRTQRNRTLADANLGELRWQLQSKSVWYGSTVVVADKHAATGRICSACGRERTNPVPPALEEFHCPGCGWSGDRRVNTARVLAGIARGANSDALSGRESSKNARGGDERPAVRKHGGRSPAKREARARPPGRGETGTLGP